MPPRSIDTTERVGGVNHISPNNQQWNQANM
jgi:hypothetical protein